MQYESRILHYHKYFTVHYFLTYPLNALNLSAACSGVISPPAFQTDADAL